MAQKITSNIYDKFYRFFGKRKEQTPEYRMGNIRIRPPKTFYGTQKDFEDIQALSRPQPPADREEGVYGYMPNDPILNSTASTINYPNHLPYGTINPVCNKHVYEYERLIYTKTDLDKIVMMLTLWIDDIATRDKLEEIYQCWKDTQKV
jgi:hypothetical protein